MADGLKYCVDSDGIPREFNIFPQNQLRPYSTPDESSLFTFSVKIYVYMAERNSLGEVLHAGVKLNAALNLRMMRVILGMYPADPMVGRGMVVGINQ